MEVEWRVDTSVGLVLPLLDRGSLNLVNISNDRRLFNAIDDKAKASETARCEYLAGAARYEIESTDFRSNEVC